jgi:methylase of polypeptide subunit release factors
LDARRSRAERFDLVVSNPPYVASDDIAALPPRCAASRGSRSTAARTARRVSPDRAEAARVLVPGGALVWRSARAGAAVAELLVTHGFTSVGRLQISRASSGSWTAAAV